MNGPTIVTLIVLGVTGIFTVLALVDPPFLLALRRTPGALAQHQYWRLITPVLVHDGGWRQIAFNFPATLIVGAIVERVYSRSQWLLVYISVAVTGELAGLACQPYGAGNSVPGAGLLGAIGVWLLTLKAAQARVGAFVLLGGAVVLTMLQDLHGPPLLVGARTGVVMLRRQR